MARNKVIFGGSTIMDITDTTATASRVLSGYYFYTNAGVKTSGSCTFDADTTDANAADSEILTGKSAYVNGNKITGAMPNNGGISATISSLSPYTVPSGFHDGSGKVYVSSTNIVAGNIKAGVVILGVTGDYTGASISAQTKTVTPSISQQVITADTGLGYDYLAQVTVESIPYSETPNAYGTTVTIG